MNVFFRTNFFSLLKSATSTIITLFIAQFGVMISGSLFQIFLNRQLGAEYGGVFALTSASALLLAVFVDFGYDLIIPQQIAQNQTVPKVFQESLAVKTIIWFWCMIIICSVTTVLWVYRIPEFNPGIILLYCCWVLPRSITMSLAAVFRGLLYTRPISIVENVISLAGYMVCCGLLFLEYQPFIILYLIISVFIFAECGKMIWLAVILRRHDKQVIFFSKSANLNFVKWFWQKGLSFLCSKEHWGFLFTQCLSTIEARLGIYLLGVFASQAEVGYFAAVQRILSLIRVLPGSILQGLIPYFSTSISYKHFIRLTGLVLTAGLIGSTVLWVFAEPIILLIYGSSFTISITILKICAWMFLAQMVLHTLEALFLATGKTRYINSFMVLYITFVVVVHWMSFFTRSAISTSSIILITQYGLISFYIVSIFQMRKKIFY